MKNGALNFLMMALLATIHFASNSYDLSQEEIPNLGYNIDWLKNNPHAVIILEGHCDEWGKDSYNLELGDRRAREVKSYLLSQGIKEERVIMVVSYGQRVPLDTRHVSEAWGKNRRVEFVLR